jgi:predicted nucleotidyltransferase
MVTSFSTPEAVELFGKTRRAILSLLFTHSDESFYLRRIVRLTGIGLGPVQRELDKLVIANILTRHRSGHQVYYQVNSKSPIFQELKSIIIKTCGVVDILKSALMPLSKRIKVAFIYGSFAHGEETTASDIDMMIIGNVSMLELIKALSHAQKTLMREINPSNFTLSEIKNRLKSNDSFIETVFESKKIFLVGDEDELERMG